MLVGHERRNPGSHLAPFDRQFFQPLVAARGQAIMNSTTAVDFCSTACDKFFALEMVKIRVDTTFTERDVFPGLKLNGFHNFVAVHLFSGKELENEQFRNTV